MCSKPTAHEDEYFARVEFERRRGLARETAAKFLPEGRSSRRDMPWWHGSGDRPDEAGTDFRGAIPDPGSPSRGLGDDQGKAAFLLEEDRTDVIRPFQGLGLT